MTTTRRAALDTRSPARQRLVEAAAAVIDRHGEAGATSRAITEHAGENLGSITYYFGSKDDLVAEALAFTARELLVPVITTLTGPDDPVTKLLLAVRQLTTLLDHERTRLSGYADALAAAAHDDRLDNHLRSLLRELKAVVADNIERQQHDGLIPPWVAPAVMADLIVALANGVAINTAIDSQTNAAAIGQQFATLLLNAGQHPLARDES